MATIEISTTQNVGIHLEAASALHRAGAWLVDMFLLVAGFISLLVLLNLVEDTGVLPGDAMRILVIGYVVVYLCYPVVTESLLNGQSLGKKLIGIRVVCLDGSRPTIGAYAIRWILGLFELTLSFGALAFLTILLSRHNQRIGDIIAGTTVVRIKRGVTLDELALSVNETAASTTFPEARSLSDEDVQVLRDVLRAHQIGMSAGKSTQILLKAVEGVEQKLGVTNSSEPEQFLREVIDSYGRIHGS